MKHPCIRRADDLMTIRRTRVIENDVLENQMGISWPSRCNRRFCSLPPVSNCWQRTFLLATSVFRRRQMFVAIDWYAPYSKSVLVQHFIVYAVTSPSFRVVLTWCRQPTLLAVCCNVHALKAFQQSVHLRGVHQVPRIKRLPG